MKRAWFVSVLALLVAAPIVMKANENANALVVTSTNTTANQLLVYSPTGVLLQTIATGGQGGVSGNAGGIAVREHIVAVVNFQSGSVSLFERRGNQLGLTDVIAAASSPVSVAFGKDHLYILGTTTIESHRVDGHRIDASPDGVAPLLRADGSAAQVGIAGDQLVITEKSNTVEIASLKGGAVTSVSAVELPAGSDTPFGLVTRGQNAYVTIAHSDEVSLVKNGRVITTVATGVPGGAGQHAPCWVALVGPFLYTANSPSQSISRLIATGAKLLIDEPVAAVTAGAPTDLAATQHLLAVLDASGGVSRLNEFAIDDGGALTRIATSIIASPANGVAIVTD